MDGGRKEKKHKYAAERDSQVGNVLLSDVNITRAFREEADAQQNAFMADQ